MSDTDVRDLLAQLHAAETREVELVRAFQRFIDAAIEQAWCQECAFGRSDSVTEAEAAIVAWRESR